MEAKRLNLEEKTFEANGKTYQVTQHISIDRFIEFERLQAHVGFGIDFKNIYEKLGKAYEHMNKNKLADAAVIIHNLANGIGENLEKREHPILNMCALFINRDDENAGVLDEDLMEAKIKDWKEEGYAMDDFFSLAFNFVDGFIPAYKEIIQNISEEAEKVLSSTGKSES